MTLSQTRRRRRSLARHRAADSPNLCGARLCGAERAAVRADAARAGARLRLPLHAELGRARLPLLKELSARGAGILLRGDPAGDRDRLCRARADEPHHVGGGERRLAAAGVPHLARARAARLPGGCGALAAADVAQDRALFACTPSPTRGAVRAGEVATARRAFPSSTRSWSGACAPSPCRSSTAAARRSPASTSPPTPRASTRNHMRDAVPAAAEGGGGADFERSWPERPLDRGTARPACQRQRVRIVRFGNRTAVR